MAMAGVKVVYTWFIVSGNRNAQLVKQKQTDKAWWAFVHWFSVHFRIQFKAVTIAFKTVNGKAPSFISDLIQTCFWTGSN